MTAVDVDALDKLREALAEAMASSARGNTYAQWAATILPVVVQFANQRAAAELRAAADVWEKHGNSWRQILAHNTAPFEYARWARTRADELDPS